MMMNAMPATTLFRVLAAGLLLSGSDAALAQASALPLPPSQDPPPASQPIQRQTGMRVIEAGHDQKYIVRSFEPDSVQGQYRIDFEALDANGDGYLSRSEVTDHPTLSAEFRAVDANNDGRLSREELAGWIR